MIVYDITDRESFKSVDNWMSEVDKFASQNVNKLLIGNKIDLTSDREVTYEEGQVNKSFITSTNFLIGISETLRNQIFRNLS